MGLDRVSSLVHTPFTRFSYAEVSFGGQSILCAFAVARTDLNFYLSYYSCANIFKYGKHSIINSHHQAKDGIAWKIDHDLLSYKTWG